MTRPGKYIVLGIAGLMALSGCAPVIETGRDMTPLPLEAGKKFGQVTIVIIAGNLEQGPDLIDPAKLRTALEDQMKASGVISQPRVLLSTARDASEIGRAEAAIVLTRLHSTIQSLRSPPSPPLGIGLLYPLVTPLLLKRDYLKLQAALEAELLFYGADGAVTKQLFLSETADGRANFFNSGGAGAAGKLVSIALHNFCRRVLSEFLYLTR